VILYASPQAFSSVFKQQSTASITLRTDVRSQMFFPSPIIFSLPFLYASNILGKITVSPAPIIALGRNAIVNMPLPLFSNTSFSLINFVLA